MLDDQSSRKPRVPRCAPGNWTWCEGLHRNRTRQLVSALPSTEIGISACSGARLPLWFFGISSLFSEARSLSVLPWSAWPSGTLCFLDAACKDVSFYFPSFVLAWPTFMHRHSFLHSGWVFFSKMVAFITHQAITPGHCITKMHTAVQKFLGLKKHKIDEIHISVEKL
jgi:hypothetical protein